MGPIGGGYTFPGPPNIPLGIPPPNCGPPGPPPPGPPPPGPPNAGPELLGRPNCDGEPKGPPGPGPGPLYGGPAEFGGGGKPAPLTFCGGPGPGVEEPEGAGDAVYCGVLEPGGGPPGKPPGPLLPPAPPAGDPWPTEGKTGPAAPKLLGALPFGVKEPGPPADWGPGPTTTSPGPPPPLFGGPALPGPPLPFQLPGPPPVASSFRALGRLSGAPGARRLSPGGRERERDGEGES